MNIDSCPGSWQCKSVIDLISDIGERKGSVQRQMYNKEGKYPIVDQGSGLVGGYTDDEFLVYKKDLPIILFGDHTRNFKYLDFPFAAGADGTKLFRANEELCNPKFLYFALLHLDIPSRGYNRHFRMLRNQTIAFPKSINEQRAIAFVLSKIQAAAETQDRIIARLKELKAATMVKLFREGTRGEKLKMTEIGEMPESWKMISMGDVVEIKQGQVDPKKDPYASMIHIGPENIEVETGRLLPCSTAREQGLISGKYLFIKGDIVYSKIRPYLKKAIIAPSEGICSADVYPLTVKEGYNSLFIHGVILSELFTRQAAAQQGRTGIPKLNREQLNSILISAPSLEEQFIIGNILRMMDLRLENAIGIYCNMSSLFSSMLHLLLTARLRLPAEIIAAAGAGAPEPRREAPPPKDSCASSIPRRSSSSARARRGRRARTATPTCWW